MPRRFTDQEKSLIKIKLIKCGQDLFGRFGFDKTSLDQIVQAAGIAKGSFYKFFPNKELYYLGCLAHFEEEMDRDVITPIIEKSRSVNELLNDLFNLASFAKERFPLIRSWFETSSRERILAALTPEQIEGFSGVDDKRMTLVSQRIKYLDARVNLSPAYLTSLYRSFFFLTEHQEMICQDFEQFKKDFSKTIIKGLLNDQC